MFATTELAARIDEAEARLSAALGGVAVARRPESAFVDPIAGGSEENSGRQGFALLYSRALLVKPPGLTT